MVTNAIINVIKDSYKSGLTGIPKEMCFDSSLVLRNVLIDYCIEVKGLNSFFNLPGDFSMKSDKSKIYSENLTYLILLKWKKVYHS